MRRFTDQSFGAPAAGRSRLAAAPRPPMTTLRRDGIGRPDELECIIVIAVLLEGTCNASVRAFCARDHRTLVRSGSYQRMSRWRLFAMIKSPRRLARGGSEHGDITGPQRIARGGLPRARPRNSRRPRAAADSSPPRRVIARGIRSAVRYARLPGRVAASSAPPEIH